MFWLPSVHRQPGFRAGVRACAPIAPARLFATLAGTALFVWRGSMLMTLGASMAVYLPLHLGIGW